MDRIAKLFAPVICVAALVGCGSKTPLNTAPLTDAEKAAIKAQDQQVDAEENAANTKKKKR
ncbi:hypothetical protein GobsT_45580 [Gemmata obscuriglobus]|uniref:Lipoprotein n=1 Tax=Gemmata obscuriglobus TaxID=114 RepID=A0A2Z3GUP7_9BACT|nr:hypothetical protein [Gemmata obscuriglobus]AWM37473.1 hypothetical protein C1280_10900 [Gemmata obscuriglobus]QEG29760.1 hypothetical protein GobsT_45580 [Gemmata obscuriglobus]VTS09077.1 unnamed protein product [Gemmata obscuriglobus UQM 2246]